jgi:hypothetical protein
MPIDDPDRILALLRDPNVGSQEVAEQTGLPRAEAARAARLLVGLPKARPEEIATLPGPFSAALLRAAVAGELIDLLSGLAASSEKGVAKDAKRALHVLRTRGVSVPEPQRAPVPTPSPVVEEVFPSYASTVDGQGERAIWIARNVPGRGIEVGQAVVSDVLGLLELQVGVLGRKEYRTFGKEIGERGQAMGVAELDPGHARAIVAEARRRNDGSGRPAPEGADAWLARIGPGTPNPDPATSLPPLPEEAEARALAASGGLHALPMLRGWLADEAALRALAARLDELAAVAGTSGDPERAGRVDGAIAEAVEAWLDAPCRQRLAARLFTVGVHMKSMGLEDRAAAAAAAARALSAGVPGRDVPFAREMVEKAFPNRGAAAPAAPARPVIAAQRP